MITRVDIVDFISHSDTTLEFNDGINVIVGPNGSGKSSVVDAITFALYGEHTRSSKSLVRRGESSGYTTVEFNIGERTFDATRKLKAGATSASTFREKLGGNWDTIAAGERKQMGESMTREVAEVIGMDFETMQIASIIRQGELADIIHEEPRVFKSRINSIVGIDALEGAAQAMGKVIPKFREAMRTKHGFDDMHLPTLHSEISESKDALNEAKSRESALSIQMDKLQGTVRETTQKLEHADTASRALESWNARISELNSYVRNKRDSAKVECEQLEETISECNEHMRACMKDGVLRSRGEIDAEIKRLEAQLEEAAAAAKARMAYDQRRDELDSYVRARQTDMSHEHNKLESAISQCTEYLEQYQKGTKISAQLESEKQNIIDTETAINTSNTQLASLSERSQMSEKLVIKDGKCPVCNSKVDTLNDLFVKMHIDGEISAIRAKLVISTNSNKNARQKVSELQIIADKASAAKAALEAYSVSDVSDIDDMRNRVKRLSELLDAVDACLKGDWKASVVIDESAKKICDALIALERDITDITNVDEIKDDLGTARRAANASISLEAHSVKSTSDIAKMTQNVGALQESHKLANACLDGKWKEASAISEQAKAHCDALYALEAQIGKPSEHDASILRHNLDDARLKLNEATSSHGAAQENVTALDDRIKRARGLYVELGYVHKYVQRLEAIRDVFKRDGAVATSMRSWALSTISAGSTEHLAVLDTRINRITLAESPGKRRSLEITCHAGKDAFEIESLSGGEQACVALSLRLGMSKLIGTGKPQFVILDEPTAHLDSEHRKSLARVLVGLAGRGKSNRPIQFIIITHDVEIFEEAAIERYYEFEPSGNGTVCTLH